jgi:hypothetical protein
LRGKKAGAHRARTGSKIRPDFGRAGFIGQERHPDHWRQCQWKNPLANEIWVGRELIYLRAMEPLQRWYEDPRVAEMVKNQGRDWAHLKAYERADALITWVKEKKAVVIMDDAHKLAGRKLDITIQLGRDAGRFVVGSFAENSIPMSLRMLIDKRDPQRIALTSEAAYDVTNLAMWLAVLAAVGVGWWQLAAVMGGMKVLATGRAAAKQS